jgi:hypothetical protein
MKAGIFAVKLSDLLKFLFTLKIISLNIKLWQNLKKAGAIVHATGCSAES